MEILYPLDFPLVVPKPNILDLKKSIRQKQNVNLITHVAMQKNPQKRRKRENGGCKNESP